MKKQWQQILLVASALGLVMIGLAGLVLPIIPGVVLIITGAIILDRAYPKLKHHPRLQPHLKKMKIYLNSLIKK